MSDKLVHDQTIDRKTTMKLLEVAARAPSSHNTQPWTVTIEKNTDITIGFDSARQLLVGDPDKRELYISLGCFVESLVLAASDMGYTAAYTFLSTDQRSVARLSLRRNLSPSADRNWTKLILGRRSDRRLYEPKSLSAQTIKQLESQTYADAHVVLFDSKEDVAFLSDMTYTSTFTIMSRQDFRNELASWVRHNWTKKPDGMPGYTQGIPGPVSLLAPFVVKKGKGIAADQAKKDAKRVIQSAAVGLICIPKNEPRSWIAAGRLYQRLCLEAALLHISTSAVSAAVIDPTTTKKTIHKLKLTDKPIALMRFGYSHGKVPKPTPRRSANDLIS